MAIYSEFRQAKVKYLYKSPHGQEDVRWLNVTMDNACRVSNVHAMRGSRHMQHFRKRHWLT